MSFDFSGTNLIIFIVALLLSVGLHEAMHGFAAYWLGDTTAKDAGRLTLNPLAHLDLSTSILLPIILVIAHLPPFFAAKPVPFNPARVKYDEYGAALIGLAGPFTNLGLAVLASLIVRLMGPGISVNIFNILVTFVMVNIALFVFNMIPFPPLDGSRLLYAFAPEAVQRVMYQIESGGFLSIMIFMIIIFSTNLGTIIVSINNHILNFLL